MNVDQRRYRSDLLKYRAVEALKKKNVAAEVSANNIEKKNDDSSKKEIENKLDFGDDHQLAGLTAAATADASPPSRNDNSNTLKTAGLETQSSPTTAPPRPNTTHDTPINTQGVTNSDPVQEVTNSNHQAIDSSPWAHMQLHEFAPKIVVVGVGGAGTNAVNNMVASGLSGELFCVTFALHHCSMEMFVL